MATYSYNFPVLITAQGLQPVAPANILTQLTANVALTNPGYTNNLPGSLIEDVSSTDVAAIALCNQAQIDLGNSLSPNGSNQPLLLQLGTVAGIPMGTPTFVNVGVTFTGTPGYLVTQGTLVSDGTYTYSTNAPVIVPSSGPSAVVTAIAVNSSQTVVPGASTVTAIRTSVPGSYTLTVTNPSAGNPATAVESWQSYRARVLQGGLAACVGTARFIKTLSGQVPGIVPRLINVQQASPGIRVIIGGTFDPYVMALAILQSVADPSELVGSAVSSGRNVTANVIDYPDIYTVEWVSPPAQVVTMTVTWNTSASSFSGGAAFPSLTIAPMAAYINALSVSQPINLLELTAIFQQSIAAVLDPNLLTRLVFSVFINSTLTPPATGYSSIAGDPESYFTCAATAITVVQG